MKKIKSLFIMITICLLVFCGAAHCFTVGAAQKATTVSVVDLIRLKKHLIDSFDYNKTLDYNNDNRTDARDLVFLKSVLLGIVDLDGYNNTVVKPQEETFEMKEELKATFEIVYFERNAFITASEDHNNGYIDSGVLSSILENLNLK